MSKEPKATAKPEGAEPLLKVTSPETVVAKKPGGLLADALAAKPAREAEEAKAKAAYDELEKSGKLEVPAPITGYEEQRAKLGEPADAPKDAE